MSTKKVVFPISEKEVIDFSDDNKIHDFSKQNTITHTMLNSAERSLILNHFKDNPKDLIEFTKLAKKNISNIFMSISKR